MPDGGAGPGTRHSGSGILPGTFATRAFAIGAFAIAGRYIDICWADGMTPHEVLDRLADVGPAPAQVDQAGSSTLLTCGVLVELHAAIWSDMQRRQGPRDAHRPEDCPTLGDPGSTGHAA